MIKNIVFDMGKVLMNFDPDAFIKWIGITDPKDAEILKREVYLSVEWAMMDRGTLTDEQACKIMEKRVPDHLKDCIKELTYKWNEPIIPIEGAKEVIAELKQNGYKIYLLSNASLNQLNYWDKIPGSEYFDGTLVSSTIKMVKPQLEIFDYFIDKFKLKKEECFFIDDSPHNVDAAQYCGINGMVFHGDYKEVREKLIKNGVKIKSN